MKIVGQVAVLNGVTSADPVTDPELVPPGEILDCPYFDGNGNPQRAALVLLDGESRTTTVTCDVYALDDSTDVDALEGPTPTTLAARRFYLVKSALVLTARTVAVVPGPLAGKLWLRVTAESLANDAVVKLIAVPAALVAS